MTRSSRSTAIAGIAPLLRFAAPIGRPPRPRRLRPGQRLAAAFEELGPSFIKLGQLLSTRADLLGEEITADLASCRTACRPFRATEARAPDRGGIRPARWKRCSPLRRRPRLPPHRSRRCISPSPPTATRSRSRCCGPGSRPPSPAISTSSVARRLGRAHRSRACVGSSRSRSCRPWPKRCGSRWICASRPPPPPSCAENFAGDPTFRVPRVDWLRTGRTVLTIERVGGIRIDDREAILAAGHRSQTCCRRPPTPFSTRCSATGFSTPTCIPGTCSSTRRRDRRRRFRHHGPARPSHPVLPRRHAARVSVRGLPAGGRGPFRRGYVPPGSSVDAFTQACRSIGEPILGSPLQEISVARLLAQLFRDHRAVRDGNPAAAFAAAEDDGA